MKIDAFIKKHGLTLSYGVGAGGRTARISNAEVKIDDFLLKGVYGVGANDKIALKDYAKEISGTLLIIDAYKEARREIKVPKLTA